MEAGYSLPVCDLNAEPIKELEGHGAKAASSSEKTSQNIEVTITMLPACDEVKTVVLEHLDLERLSVTNLLSSNCNIVSFHLAEFIDLRKN